MFCFLSRGKLGFFQTPMGKSVEKKCNLKLKKRVSVSNYTRQKKLFFPKMELNNEVWELDFFSRPVVNQEGKKIWELIVVGKDSDLEHVEPVPNAMVNSKELRKRLLILIEKTEKKPKVIKFFRSQMFNMINIALSELDIVVKPSRRTFKLMNNIAKREKEIYPKMEGYKPFMKELDPNLGIKRTPERLPDALRGEKFTFASLGTDQFSNIQKLNPLFLDSGPLNFSDDQKTDIPGIILFSSRSKSLASWLESVELYSITCDIEEKDLCMECGLDVSYLVAKLAGENINEAKTFEKNKARSQGLHFIAVQNSEKNNSIEGLWVLKTQERS